MILVQIWKGIGLWILLPVGIAGVFCIAMGLPLALGKVPPNKFFGLGTAKTLSDEKAWYDSNRSLAKVVLIVGVVLIVASLAVYFLWDALSEMTRLLILAVVVLGSIAILVSRGFKILDQLND